MTIIAQRIKIRLGELGLKQTDAAKTAGCSPQRFGNYVQGTRPPDVATLARISAALSTTPDYLMGFSDERQIEIFPVVIRLLELEGVNAVRAEAIARAVQEALSLLRAMPFEGDTILRSRIAAQAAWQMRTGAKLS